MSDFSIGNCLIVNYQSYVSSFINICSQQINETVDDGMIMEMFH